MGQGITDRPVPPWELSGGFRLDQESHRGRFLESLGDKSLLAGVISINPLALPVFGPLALGLAVAVLAMARRDLALMRLGYLDRGGEEATRRARRYAVGAAVLPLVMAPAWAYYLGQEWWPALARLFSL